MNVQELKAKAASHEQAAFDSFENCDTDGHLSQWAHGVNAAECRLKAELLEAGGVAQFLHLFDTEDRLVDARIIENAYGTCWLLSEVEATRFGRKFVPAGRKSKVQKQLCLHEDFVELPAKVIITGREWNVSPQIVQANWKQVGCYFGHL